VVGVKAQLHITRMTNTHTSGNIPDKNTVRNPMDIDWPVYVPSLAVAPAYGASEYPAITVYEYFLHQAVNSWSRFRSSFHKYIIAVISDAVKTRRLRHGNFIRFKRLNPQ
jgi:hypothetical protein